MTTVEIENLIEDKARVLANQLIKQRKLEKSVFKKKLEVLMVKKKPWHLFKQGWLKHTDPFGQQWWVKLNN